MKKSFLKRLGFTLIELLVVISIIGILASLAIPAVTGALTRGQLTGTLNNARQIAIASQTISLDALNTGDTNALGWPGTNSFAGWATQLTFADISTNDIQKLLSAPGKPATWPPTTAASAFTVYGVIDSDPGDTIFLTTANWDATQPAIPSGEPYQDKGFVVMRKGMDGTIYRGRQGTNDIAFFGNTNVKPKIQ